VQQQEKAACATPGTRDQMEPHVFRVPSILTKLTWVTNLARNVLPIPPRWSTVFPILLVSATLATRVKMEKHV